MRKGFIRKLIVAVSMSLMFSMNSFAQVYKWNGVEITVDDDVSVLLPEGQKSSRDVRNSYARGTIISTAIASITNVGGGKIEILLDTLAHTQCDEIRHTAYLERWDEEHQAWDQVAHYDFVELQSDHPDEDLTSLVSSVIVDDQPAGYYYRVRGLHCVWSNGTGEGFATRTDGVLITSEP